MGWVRDKLTQTTLNLPLRLRLFLHHYYPVEVDQPIPIPTQGGLLLLGNHVSLIDAVILERISPRAIHFVVDPPTHLPQWQQRLFSPKHWISPTSRTLRQQVQQKLQEGEAVCLFPEGAMTRNGQLQQFGSAFEQMVDGSGATILPFYLHGLWGTPFSQAHHKQPFSPFRPIPRQSVHLLFAAPQTETLSAAVAQQQVEQLSLDAWQQESNHYPTLQQAWIHAAKQIGFRTALNDVITGDSFSGIKLLIAATLIARRIQQQSKSSRIGVLLPTTAAGVITNLAILLCGRTVVNLNYSASTESIADAIQLSGIDTVYTSARFLQKLEEKGKHLRPALTTTTVIELESIRKEISTFERLTTAMMVALFPTPLLQKVITEPTSIDQFAAILFSSGSEGKPKGIPLSHRNILCNIRQIVQMLQPQLAPDKQDTMLSSLPLFHSFGLTATTLMPLIEGIPLVTAPDPTDTMTIVEAIEQHQATLYIGTPTFLQWMSRNPKVLPHQLTSIRRVVSGAEPLKQAVREGFEAKFNKPIYEGYGATEMSPAVCVNIPDEHTADGTLAQKGNSIGSVGRPLPGTLLRIVDRDTLEPLPVAEDGLILMAGVQRMSGYLGTATPQPWVEQNGIRWYSSGDKGHIDKAGFLTIVDRYSRFAKIGGEMVSLSAMESQIKRLSTESIEVAIVATPDLRKGEKLTLFYHGTPSASDLSHQIRTSAINPLMVPAEVISVEEIPLLGSGKRNYGLMKTWALQSS